MSKLTSKIGLLFFFTFLHSFQFFAQVVDQHIDPSSEKTLFNISFVRHIDVDFSEQKINDLLKFASKIVQNCDSKATEDQDVGCQITFQLSGSLNTFGMAGDGLDIITTLQEQSQVLGTGAGFVKIIKASLVNGNTQTGAAYSSSSTMYLSTSSPSNPPTGYPLRSSNDMGQTFAHEFIHAQGYSGHRGDPGNEPIIGNPIMAPSFEIFYTEINAAECSLLHNGFNNGTNNGPYRSTKVAFVIDDTGSMSEEIDGVKQALIRVLNGYDANACGTVFQLTTFKDAVNTRNPTTDISILQSQINGLSATGGGDCPEASVEALNAAQEMVEDNGTIFLATDASPSSNIDLSAAISALQSRNIKVSIVLSGDCVAQSSLATSEEKDMNDDLSSVENANSEYFPPSNNEDSDSYLYPNLNGFSAIEAFSFLAEETGGIFAFIPEVNSNIVSDKQRYENTVYNVIQGGITKSVAFSQPNKGVQGGTMSITVTGANTNFNNNTTLAFTGGGITVTDLNIISPTKMEAIITIASGTALGFKDLVTSTPVPGGGIESAVGEGAFEVINASSIPTILSISPPSSAQGEVLTTVIYGINTHFSASSVVSLGNGINVTGINVINANTLEATISIAADAPAGFRNVVVVTGNEIAAENIIGPFFVTLSTASPCNTGITCSAIPLQFNGEETLSVSQAITLTLNEGSCEIADVFFFPNVITCNEIGQVIPVNVNVTDVFGNTAICQVNIDVVGFPCRFGQAEVGCNGSAFYNFSTNKIEITSDGCYYPSPYNSDQQMTVLRDLCGNGELITHVETINGFGWAGLSMRSTAAANSVKFQLMINGNSSVRREVRSTTGGQAFPNFTSGLGKRWLRLVRSGNQVSGYISSNGTNWQFISAANLNLPNCIEMGMIVTSNSSNDLTTGIFGSVIASGAVIGVDQTDFHFAQNSEGITQSRLFPNPSNNFVQVAISDYIGKPVKLEMINTLGQVLWQYDTYDLEDALVRIPLKDSWTEGIYQVSLYSEKQIETWKLIIVR